MSGQPVQGARPQPPASPPAAAGGGAGGGSARRGVLVGVGVVVAAAVGYLTSVKLQERRLAGDGGGAAEPGKASGGAAAGAPALAAVADVPAGGGKILEKDKIVLTNQGGTVRAFSATCTHQGCTVTSVSGGTINCACHGSKFDAATGKVVDGPAPSPLAAVAVQVRDGNVVRG